MTVIQQNPQSMKDTSQSQLGSPTKSHRGSGRYDDFVHSLSAKKDTTDLRGRVCFPKQVLLTRDIKQLGKIHLLLKLALILELMVGSPCESVK